eukprot:54916-Heterocapsa_arctica.AAC.1
MEKALGDRGIQPLDTPLYTYPMAGDFRRASIEVLLCRRNVELDGTENVAREIDKNLPTGE